jgi:Paired amphipathic helix repeat
MDPSNADDKDDGGEAAPMDVEPTDSSSGTNQAPTGGTTNVTGTMPGLVTSADRPQGEAEIMSAVAPKPGLLAGGAAASAAAAAALPQRPSGVVVPPKKTGFALNKARGLPMAKKSILSTAAAAAKPPPKPIAPKLPALPISAKIKSSETAVSIVTSSSIGTAGKLSFARGRGLPVVQKFKIQNKEEPSSESTSTDVDNDDDDDDDDDDMKDDKPMVPHSGGPPVADTRTTAPVPSDPPSSAATAVPAARSRDTASKDPPEDVPPPMMMNIQQQHQQPVPEPSHESSMHHHQQQHHPEMGGPPPVPHHHQAPPPGHTSMPMASAMHGPMQPGQYPPGRMPNNRPVKELKVEDALLYLDDVKREFAMQPAIYNEFLVIMKNFKSQTVDTPGVIARVSKLFRGYNNLILGFNTFLPEGHKISMDDLKRMERERVQQEAEEEEKKNAAAAAAAAATRAEQAAPTGHRGGGRGQQKSSPDRTNSEGGGGRPPQQHATVEFDHAISYVTTIKRRFSNDASTYHQFLEILHNYQKEQRGIKEVLEQVAHLFQDHPDLLKEFTFFLPDSVQEQARERMHRAAAESESRIAQRQKQAQQQQQQQQLELSRSPQQLQPLGGSASSSVDASRKNDQTAAGAATAISGSKRNFEMSHATSQDQYVYNAAVERQFFDETRETLSALTRDGGQNWGEFLKCLDLYAQEQLSRNDMLKHVEPILGKRNSHLFEEFKRILSVAGSASISNQVLEDSWYSVPLAEIDFSRCRKCSPSPGTAPRLSSPSVYRPDRQ